MDMLQVKKDVETVIAGLRKAGTNEDFIEIIRPVLPALVRGQPNAYMSAVDLVGLASEMVLSLYDADDLLDFGKYMEKTAKITMKCAQTKSLANDGTHRSND